MKFSLRTLLILPFLIQLLGITGLLSYFSYRTHQRTMVTMADRIIAETSDQISQSLTNYFQIPLRLTQHHRAEIIQGVLDPLAVKTLETYFIEQLRLYPEVSSLMIAMERQSLLSVSRSQPDQIEIYQRSSSADLSTTTVTSLTGELRHRQATPPAPGLRPGLPDPTWGSLLEKHPEGLWLTTVAPTTSGTQPLVMMAYLLPFIDGRGQQGVLGTSVYLHQLGSFLRRLRIGDTGQAFILDEAGQLVALSTDESPVHADAPSPGEDTLSLDPAIWRRSPAQVKDPITQTAGQLAAAIQPQATATQFRFRWQGTRYLGRVVPFTLQNQLHWRVVVVMPEAEVVAAKATDFDPTLLLYGLALTGVIGIGLWTAESITRPILSLKRATQAFTDGMAVVPPTHPTRIEEVEALRQGFDRMVGQLVHSFRTLKNRENTLATFLNGVPVAISVHNPRGDLLFLNSKGKALLGDLDKPGKLNPLASNVAVYLAGSDQPYPSDRLPVIRGLRGETAYADDLEVDTEVGRIPLEVHTIPVFDGNGQVLYAINTFQDIRERRQAERLRANYERELEAQVAEQTASLASSEATKQALINAIPDLLMRLSPQGEPMEIYNLDAVRWLGDRGQIDRDSMYQNLPPGVAAERQRCMELALTTGTVQRQEYEFSLNGQVYWEEARIIPVSQEEILLVVRDISERRRVDRLKDDFIAIVSHELRTPLTAIRGALGILDAGVLQDRPDKAQHLLKMALANTERLIRLVNDILDLERLTSGRVELVKEVCPVSALMTAALEGLEAIALEAAVEIYLEPLELNLWVAPDAIVQTLTNLLSNAIKFSTAGDAVYLKAELTATDQVLFTVQDQGRGIPADRLQTIFERFKQVDVSDSRQKGGTGLGLAICKSIIEQHGGRIWAESVLGQGSCFYFTLPIIADHQEGSSP
jgi:signal transduction histidine kinase